MQKSSILVAVSIIILVFYCSCHKSSGSSSNITATVNGQSFSRSNCVYISDTGTYKLLEVFGADYNPAATVGVNTFLFPMIQLTIYDFTSPGTFAITDTFRGTTGGNPYPTAPVAIASYQTSDTTQSAGVYGTITITETTPVVTGTFSFTCADSTRVTGGKFTATAQ